MCVCVVNNLFTVGIESFKNSHPSSQGHHTDVCAHPGLTSRVGWQTLFSNFFVVCLHLCPHACGGQRSAGLGCCPLEPTFLFGEGGSHWPWSSSGGLAKPGCQPPGSSCLCLCLEITSIGHAWLLTCVLGIQRGSSGLH